MTLIKITGRAIAAVGALMAIKAVYNGFNAQAIAIETLGTTTSEFVTRKQFAFTDNLRVISFLRFFMALIFISFIKAPCALRWKCAKKCVWKIQTAKLIAIMVISHVMKDFKVENQKMGANMIGTHKLIRLTVFGAILGHIYLCYKVGKK